MNSQQSVRWSTAIFFVVFAAVLSHKFTIFFQDVLLSLLASIFSRYDILPRASDDGLISVGLIADVTPNMALFLQVRNVGMRQTLKTLA